MEPTVELVDVNVRRARRSRYTGWLVDCAECGIVSPVMARKQTAIREAQSHGTAEHNNNCRVLAPR